MLDKIDNAGIHKVVGYYRQITTVYLVAPSLKISDKQAQCLMVPPQSECPGQNAGLIQQPFVSLAIMLATKH